jgi:hypothetical protein
MSYDGRIRFDATALDRHADEYCKKELRLMRELEDTLRIAVQSAPMEAVPRIRRIMNDADRLTQYFSELGDALREAGRLVKATSQTVLERLEEATDELNALLR